MYRIGSATAPPKLPSSVSSSPELKEALEACLSLDPLVRPSARALLKLPVFRTTGGQSGNNSIASNRSLTLTENSSSNFGAAGEGSGSIVSARPAGASGGASNGMTAESISDLSAQRQSTGGSASSSDPAKPRASAQNVFGTIGGSTSFSFEVPEENSAQRHVTVGAPKPKLDIGEETDVGSTTIVGSL
jgi:serine/threonine protein kinase